MRLNAKSFGLNTKIVWGIFFITLLTILMYHYVFGHIIGFTDYYEGSKSEILRRCDSGASNENIYTRNDGINRTKIYKTHTNKNNQKLVKNPLHSNQTRIRSR